MNPSDGSINSDVADEKPVSAGPEQQTGRIKKWASGLQNTSFTLALACIAPQIVILIVIAWVYVFSSGSNDIGSTAIVQVIGAAAMLVGLILGLLVASLLPLPYFVLTTISLIVALILNRRNLVAVASILVLGLINGSSFAYWLWWHLTNQRLDLP